MSNNKVNNKDESKILNKICKLQENQDKARQEEYGLLQTYMDQMNKLLSQLERLYSTNINVAGVQKSVPFQRSGQFLEAVTIPPTNPDSYPADGTIDIYAINNSRPIPHMSLINDGPGDIYFITSQSKDIFNEQEIVLRPNDLRELFNVYEIRSRATLPLTQFRLVEGIMRTGSFAPQTKANVEIRPTVQPNQILKTFTMAFENTSTSETFQSPITQTITVDFPSSFVRPPLPRGQTAVYIDSSTGFPMPGLIPTGFQAELFGLFTNFSTYFTARGYLELNPGTDIFIPTVIEPCSPRGLHINNSPNLFFFNSAGIDPKGAPFPGRKFIVAITNDDPFYSMTGSSDLLIIYSRIV